MVIDGGTLRRQVFCSATVFKEAINEHCRYASSKYIIWQRVFDAYKHKTATDHEHARSEVHNPLCADVLVDENVNVLH